MCNDYNQMVDKLPVDKDRIVCGDDSVWHGQCNFSDDGRVQNSQDD